MYCLYIWYVWSILVWNLNLLCNVFFDATLRQRRAKRSEMMPLAKRGTRRQGCGCVFLPAMELTQTARAKKMWGMVNKLGLKAMEGGTTNVNKRVECVKVGHPKPFGSWPFRWICESMIFGMAEPLKCDSNGLKQSWFSHQNSLKTGHLFSIYI